MEIRVARTSDAEKLFADLSSGRRGRVVVDFDHTLFLDNSTERYLDALRPRALAFLIVECCDFLLLVLAKLGLCAYNERRDFARVVMCTVLMPWSIVLWRRAAPSLARGRMNRDLMAALPTDQPVIVLSYGFRHIIRPLLDAAGLSEALLVCSQLWPAQNLRRTGKVAALTAHLPESDRQEALFVTDSDDDAPVIAAIPRSHVVEWESPAEPAFSGLYVPLRYTTQCKYAGSRYFLNQIVLEDFALLLLAYAFSWHYAATLGFLLLSLYTIYEIGHYENDHKAIRLEKEPKISECAERFPALPKVEPWLWALAFALAGLTCFRLPGALPPRVLAVHLAGDLFLWLLVLVGLYGAFWAFNRLRPKQRVALFPILHLFKTFSFVLYVPLTGLGALLLAAQVISISANYALYRFTGDFSRFNRQAWRMGFFLLLAAACYSVKPVAVAGAGLWRWSLILIWGAVRSLEHARRMNILRIVASLKKGH
jgi:hypothetical protein